VAAGDVLTNEALSRIATEHVRAEYPAGFVARHVADIGDPAGAHFSGVWGGPPDPPGSIDHVMLGTGGFFVSRTDGTVTTYGSLEYIEAYQGDEVATVRAILTKRPPN
jgi:hypothetical protein